MTLRRRPDFFRPLCNVIVQCNMWSIIARVALYTVHIVACVMWATNEADGLGVRTPGSHIGVSTAWPPPCWMKSMTSLPAWRRRIGRALSLALKSDRNQHDGSRWSQRRSRLPLVASATLSLSDGSRPVAVGAIPWPPRSRSTPRRRQARVYRNRKWQWKSRDNRTVRRRSQLARYGASRFPIFAS